MEITEPFASFANATLGATTARAMLPFCQPFHCVLMHQLCRF